MICDSILSYIMKRPLSYLPFQLSSYAPIKQRLSNIMDAGQEEVTL